MLGTLPTGGGGTAAAALILICVRLLVAYYVGCGILFICILYAVVSDQIWYFYQRCQCFFGRHCVLFVRGIVTESVLRIF